MDTAPSNQMPSVTISMGDLVLVTPDALVLSEMEQLIRRGIHDPSTSPFSVPWTDQDPDDAARSYRDWIERKRGGSTRDDWTICFAAIQNGQVVGAKSISASRFPIRREVSTGSWLGLKHQGRGIGTQMRQMILNFAFNDLHALWAVSEAFADNRASCAVNEKLGYGPDGINVVARRGKPVVQNRYRLAAADWSGPRSDQIVAGHSDGWQHWFE